MRVSASLYLFLYAAVNTPVCIVAAVFVLKWCRDQLVITYQL